MEEINQVVSDPIIQYGFAGFCSVLLGIIVWLIKRFSALLIKLYERNDQVIDRNTRAIVDVAEVVRTNNERAADTLSLLRAMQLGLAQSGVDITKPRGGD